MILHVEAVEIQIFEESEGRVFLELLTMMISFQYLTCGSLYFWLKISLSLILLEQYKHRFSILGTNHDSIEKLIQSGLLA